MINFKSKKLWTKIGLGALVSSSIIGWASYELVNKNTIATNRLDENNHLLDSSSSNHLSTADSSNRPNGTEINDNSPATIRVLSKLDQYYFLIKKPSEDASQTQTEQTESSTAEVMKETLEDDEYDNLEDFLLRKDVLPASIKKEQITLTKRFKDAYWAEVKLDIEIEATKNRANTLNRGELFITIKATKEGEEEATRTMVLTGFKRPSFGVKWFLDKNERGLTIKAPEHEWNTIDDLNKEADFKSLAEIAAKTNHDQTVNAVSLAALYLAKNPNGIDVVKAAVAKHKTINGINHLFLSTIFENYLLNPHALLSFLVNKSIASLYDAFFNSPNFNPNSLSNSIDPNKPREELIGAANPTPKQQIIEIPKIEGKVKLSSIRQQNGEVLYFLVSADANTPLKLISQEKDDTGKMKEDYAVLDYIRINNVFPNSIKLEALDTQNADMSTSVSSSSSSGMNGQEELKKKIEEVNKQLCAEMQQPPSSQMRNQKLLDAWRKATVNSEKNGGVAPMMEMLSDSQMMSVEKMTEIHMMAAEEQKEEEKQAKEEINISNIKFTIKFGTNGEEKVYDTSKPDDELELKVGGVYLKALLDTKTEEKKEEKRK